MTCNICKDISDITCNYCNNPYCNKCLKYSLLHSSQEPHCNVCHTRFTQTFLFDNFSTSFINNSLNRHLQKIWFETEKSLLPSTMCKIELENARRIEKSLNIKLDYLQNEINDINIQLNNQKSKISGTDELSQFIRKCPYNDCRGFLSTKWKCKICDRKVCSKCHVIKINDKQHICNKHDIESALLIMKDSKQCPNCASLIHKVDGCDQMWCTQCHISFSWKTGMIIKKCIIHNPHYYDYIKNNNGVLPRQPNDNECGRLPDIYPLNRKFKNRNNIHTFILDSHMLINHIIDVELQKYNNPPDDENKDSDLRIKYILGDIDEMIWKRTLYMREKKRDKNTAFYHIFNMFVDVCGDLFVKLDNIDITNKDICQELTDILKEFENIRNYFNQCMDDIKKQFSLSKSINVSPNWDIEKI
jgi:hypothetical protein